MTRVCPECGNIDAGGKFCVHQIAQNKQWAENSRLLCARMETVHQTPEEAKFDWCGRPMEWTVRGGMATLDFVLPGDKVYFDRAREKARPAAGLGRWFR